MNSFKDLLPTRDGFFYVSRLTSRQLLAAMMKSAPVFIVFNENFYKHFMEYMDKFNDYYLQYLVMLGLYATAITIAIFLRRYKFLKPVTGEASSVVVSYTQVALGMILWALVKMFFDTTFSVHKLSFGQIYSVSILILMLLLSACLFSEIREKLIIQTFSEEGYKRMKSNFIKKSKTAIRIFIKLFCRKET